MNDLTDITRIPEDVSDPAWSARVLESPPEDRARVLGRADFLFERGGDADALRAVDVYILLRADLDPADAEGDRRILAVFRRSEARGPEVRYIAERTLERGFKDSRLHARIVLAQCHADGNNLEAADRLLAQVCSEITDRVNPLRALALSSLAVVYRRQGREVEALLVARRLVELARESRDPRARLGALVSLFAALYALDDTTGMSEVLTDAASLLELPDTSPETRWSWRARQVEVDIRRERFAAARAGLDAMAAQSRDVHRLGPDARLPAYLEARLQLESGNPQRAREVATLALASGEDTPTMALRLSWIEMKGTLLTEGPDAALPMALHLLDVVENSPATVLGHGMRLRFGTLMGPLFRDRFHRPGEARRCFELAAHAVLHRLVEIHRCARELPELLRSGPGDADLLASFNERLLHNQGEVMDALTRLLDSPEPPEAAQASLHRSGGLVVLCAWCRRVRAPDNLWLPVESFLPPETTFRVTHGICPDCTAVMSRA